MSDFLPRVAEEDLAPPACLRRASRIGADTTQNTLAIARRRRTSKKVSAPQNDDKFDRFVARYGGRLLGGASIEADEFVGRRPSITATDFMADSLRMKGLPPTLMMHCLVAGLTATVVGYDIGASSAALDNLVHVGGLPMDQPLSPMLQGWIVSAVWMGQLAGTMGAANVNNSRLLLLASGLLNGAGGLSASLAPNLSTLIAGRLLCGVGNGFVTVGLSQYLAEISPASGRGGGVACLETTFIMGALAGAVLGRLWLKAHGGWRWLWGMSSPMGMLAVLAMLQMPDTPRAIFLRHMAAARRGELLIEGESGGTGGGSLVDGDAEARRTAALRMARAQAEQVMCRLRMLEDPDEDLVAELDEMEEFYTAGARVRAGGASSSSGEAREVTAEMGFLEMMQSGVHRKMFLQASLVMVTPALTGHAAVMTYGTQIFQSIGYATSQGADLTIVFQVVKLLVTLPDFLWLDAVPRRTLMNAGLVSMAGCYALAIVAVPLHLPSVGAFALMASAASYQSSVGPLSWIMPTEVLPNEMRAKGSAITSTMYAGAGLMLVQLHPLLARQGPMAPLAVYGACTTVALALNCWKLPETMGLSLEAIEREAFREEEELEGDSRDPPAIAG